MKRTLITTLAAGSLLLGAGAIAQDKTEGLPKTDLQVVGGLSNLTAYQNFEQPFWTKTVPELSGG
jgi:hypothetical protein